MDREDALALLDVMRMQTVYEPPGLDAARLARAFSKVVSSKAIVISHGATTSPDTVLSRLGRSSAQQDSNLSEHQPVRLGL